MTKSELIRLVDHVFDEASSLLHGHQESQAREDIETGRRTTLAVLNQTPASTLKRLTPNEVSIDRNTLNFSYE